MYIYICIRTYIYSTGKMNEKLIHYIIVPTFVFCRMSSFRQCGKMVNRSTSGGGYR